jgi:hypothetical protein
MSNDEWYTPSSIIEAARESMGGIDLDPCSCEEAQEIVEAGTWYDKERNGLVQPWHGRVWLNPPYSKGNIIQFVNRLTCEYSTYKPGPVDAWCLLCNTDHSTERYKLASVMASFVVLLFRRVGFIAPGGRPVKKNLRCQSVICGGKVNPDPWRKLGSIWRMM